MSAPVHVHATAILLGRVGVLVRGPSGSGKSLLALALLEQWQSRGMEAFLVADDQVKLTRFGTGVSMAAPPSIAGLIELRFRGIVQRPYRSPTELHLVIDLVPELVRMPDPAEFSSDVLGVAVARAPVPQSSLLGLEQQALLVSEAIKAISPPA